MHKTRIEGALQTFTFGFMQLFNTMPPGGAMTTSTATYFSLGHRNIFPGVEKSKVKIGVLFIERTLAKINFLEHFVLFNFLIRSSPKALRACQNPQKGVCYQVC